MTSYRVYRFAGTGIGGNEDGHRLSSNFANINGICLDYKGTLYVSDTGNNSIRMIIGDQVSSLITKDKVFLGNPGEICVGEDGNIYFTNYSKHVIFKVIDGKAEVYCGRSGISGSEDGLNGTLDGPWGICKGEDSSLYITCANNSLRKVTKDGLLSTICNDLHSPYGITRDSSGNIYIAEYGASRIRKIDKQGKQSFIGEGLLSSITGLVLDLFGNLLVCEHSTGLIKRISPQGNIETLSIVDGDGKPHKFSYPTSLAVDVTGVYVAEQRAEIISKIEMLFDWNTSLHKNYPKEMKERIKSVMMITLKKGHPHSHIWKVPKDVIFIILRLVALSLQVRPAVHRAKWFKLLT